MFEEPEKIKRNLTHSQAKLKAENYCAFQERAQQEVRDKLYSWGLHQQEVEQLIANLITDNFLNEERFAKAYVSGKFKIKNWGKIKIKQGLQQKKVTGRLLKEALNVIDDQEYLETLEMLLNKKAQVIQETDVYLRKMKLARYAMGKGYENDLIFDLLNNNNL